jgi:hypothetical protein
MIMKRYDFFTGLMTWLAFTAALCLCACGNSEDPLDGEPVPVQFHAVDITGVQTRVSGAAGNQWDNNDAIGIYKVDAATQPVDGDANKQYRTFSASPGTFISVSGDEVYYPASGNVGFIAYYPYSTAATASLTVPVSVAVQTSQAGIDLLYAKTAVAYNKTSGAVNLPFAHQLVKLNMTVQPGDGFSDLSGLTVVIKGMNTAATFNLSTGSGLDAQSAPADITPHDAGGYAYEAILLPLAFPGSSHKVEFTVGGNTYTWNMSNDITGGLTGGYKYNYTIKVNKTDISVHGTITHWGNGGSLTGDATPSPVPSGLFPDGLSAGTTVTIAYTDGNTEPFTLASAGEAVTLSPANIGKTIKSITVNGGNPILIGRKNDGSDVYLKFDATGNLLLRDAGSDAIPIGSYAEFQLINTDHTTRSGAYRQEADLDLMNEAWTPIGNPGSFTGKFDGGGYTLSNLSVTESEPGAGLFGTVIDQYTVFSNIHIVSGSVSGGTSVGGICGVFPQGGRITGCSNAADVSGLNGIGGICGNNQGTVIACYNTGNITASGNAAGGVCGLNSFGTLTACYNTGNVVASTSYAGGVCAMNQGTTGMGLVTACYNTGSVVSPSIAGGVCGENQGTVTACYWWDVPGDDAGYGISSPTSTNLGATLFGIYYWPSTAAHTEWGTGDGSGSGLYWQSPGGWNDGTPVFPKLWHE